MAGQWEVSGKNFLITGGASGMGALHVENFVKEGAKQGLKSITMKGVKHRRLDDGGHGGTIINVASTTAFLVEHLMPIYSSTKSAVLHFSQSLAAGKFYETSGIRILTVCFGPTATPLLQGFENRVYDQRVLDAIQDRLGSMACQKPESAALACLEMYKKGAPGTAWLSEADKPANDVTEPVMAAYAILEAIPS